MIIADEGAWRDFYFLGAIKLRKGRGRIWKISLTLQLKLLTAVLNYFPRVLNEENIVEIVKLRVEGRGFEADTWPVSGVAALHSVVCYCQLSVFRVSDLVCYNQKKQTDTCYKMQFIIFSKKSLVKEKYHNHVTNRVTLTESLIHLVRK